jgi:hypothetical protein
MNNFWIPPKEWTLEEANARAFEVLSNPGLKEDCLPPEAALLFPPTPPDFPPLFDTKTGEAVAVIRTKHSFHLRDIPWLPKPFDMNTPGWMVNLYMLFGATPRDMVDRVSTRVDPKQDRQFLSNRLVKRSSDWRAIYGGFCAEFKAFKGGQVTRIGECILQGYTNKRAALSQEQLFFVRFRSG